jgi:osmotically-inducible protein OsmY
MAGPFSWLPIGRTAAAWWAWKNRREVGRWIGFALRAIPPTGLDGSDALAEARLRAALARDERTRGVPTLTVQVRDRVASLGGRLAPEVHDLVARLAADTKGIRRVECAIRDRGTRVVPMTHRHVVDVPAVPPRPA